MLGGKSYYWFSIVAIRPTFRFGFGFIRALSEYLRPNPNVCVPKPLATQTTNIRSNEVECLIVAADEKDPFLAYGAENFEDALARELGETRVLHPHDWF